MFYYPQASVSHTPTSYRTSENYNNAFQASPQCITYTPNMCSSPYLGKHFTNYNDSGYSSANASMYNQFYNQTSSPSFPVLNQNFNFLNKPVSAFSDFFFTEKYNSKSFPKDVSPFQKATKYSLDEILQTQSDQEMSDEEYDENEQTQTKKKRVLSSNQRTAANIRERKRMSIMNDAFVDLRHKLPISTGRKRRKMSRLDIVIGAMEYISYLDSLLSSPSNEYLNNSYQFC